MRPTDLSYHLTEYLSKYLPGQLGLSNNTIKSYCDTFSLLLKFCRDSLKISIEKITLSNLNKETVESFLTYLETDRHCSATTRNQRLAAIHAFFKYLQSEMPEKIYIFQQIISIKFKKYAKTTFVNHISLEEIKLILAQPNLHSLDGRRDLTMLAVLYDSGARVSEITDLRVCDVRAQSPATIKLCGKGSKSRIVPLMTQTKELLELYLGEQNLNDPASQSHPLFFNSSQNKLTRAGIAYVLNKYVVSARQENTNILNDKVTPHVFRHSKAMHLLQSGINIIYIRDFLGHADISTTETYAKSDAETKRIALETAYKNPAPKDVTPWQKDVGLLTFLKNYSK